MNIGQAATASGVSAKMIRYYESIGLVPPARRTESGYRIYGPRDVHTLAFIRRARSLGFPLARIKALVRLWRDDGRASAEVKAIAEAHVAELRGRIAELEVVAETLAQLARACHGDVRPDCPILADLASGCAADRPCQHEG